MLMRVFTQLFSAWLSQLRIRKQHHQRQSQSLHSGALGHPVMTVAIGPLLWDPAARAINPHLALDAPAGPYHWSVWPSKLRMDQVLYQIRVGITPDESFSTSLLWPAVEEAEFLTLRGDAPHTLDLGLDFVDGVGEAHYQADIGMLFVRRPDCMKQATIDQAIRARWHQQRLRPSAHVSLINSVLLMENLKDSHMARLANPA